MSLGSTSNAASPSFSDIQITDISTPGSEDEVRRVRRNRQMSHLGFDVIA